VRQLYLRDRERMPLLPYLSGLVEKAFAEHLLSWQKVVDERLNWVHEFRAGSRTFQNYKIFLVSKKIYTYVKSV